MDGDLSGENSRNDTSRRCEEFTYLYQEDYHTQQEHLPEEENKLRVSDLLEQQTGTFESFKGNQLDKLDNEPEETEGLQVPPTARVQKLKHKLDYLLSKFDKQEDVESDPVSQRNCVEIRRMSQ
jgi:hypothetical protein